MKNDKTKSIYALTLLFGLICGTLNAEVVSQTFAYEVDGITTRLAPKNAWGQFSVGDTIRTTLTWDTATASDFSNPNATGEMAAYSGSSLRIECLNASTTYYDVTVDVLSLFVYNNYQSVTQDEWQLFRVDEADFASHNGLAIFSDTPLEMLFSETGAAEPFSNPNLPLVFDTTPTEWDSQTFSLNFGDYLGGPDTEISGRYIGVVPEPSTSALFVWVGISGALITRFSTRRENADAE